MAEESDEKSRGDALCEGMGKRKGDMEEWVLAPERSVSPPSGSAFVSGVCGESSKSSAWRRTSERNQRNGQKERERERERNNQRNKERKRKMFKFEGERERDKPKEWTKRDINDNE